MPPCTNCANTSAMEKATHTEKIKSLPELDWVDITVEDEPFARGGYAVIYAGTYKGEPAAIKLINMSCPDQKVDISRKFLMA